MNGLGRAPCMTKWSRSSHRTKPGGAAVLASSTSMPAVKRRPMGVSWQSLTPMGPPWPAWQAAWGRWLRGPAYVRSRPTASP
eukprot:11653442-Alexandrium_andersonii.AAC.1